MAKTQRAQVVITCNSSLAKKALDEIKTHAAQLRQQYNQMAKDYDKVVAEQGKGSKAAKDMNRELKRLETTSKALDKAIKINEQDLGDVSRIMKNLSGATTRQLRQALSALKRQMENTSGSETARLRQLREQMKSVQAQIERNTGAVRRHGSAWQTSIRNIGTYIGMFAGLHQAIAKVGAAIRGNLDMSDQLSQIRMVSGLAEKDVFKLSEELRGIDTRTTLKDLQSIAYEGSKLGMGQYGVSGLKGFTEAANQLNVALKEQLGEGTLTDMSKMVENMGLIKSMGIEKALLATGSAMFKLSASSTATAGNIVEFTKRLYALAKNAGITTDQLLALGSASDSFGLMPEVAATAMNKIITAIQKQPRTVEKAVGLTPGTINRLYKAGNIMEALVEIFQKMHDMGNMNAMAPIFKDLGSDGARLNTVVVSMAENVDTLRKHLGISKQAFEEASAVTQEYNLRQSTANGILQRANNLWSKAFVNKDGTIQVKEMAQAWYDFSKEATDGGYIMSELKVAFDSILLAVRGLLAVLPFLINGLIAVGAVKGIYLLKDVFEGVYTLVTRSIPAFFGFTAAKSADTVATTANTVANDANAVSITANTGAKISYTTATEGATAATNANTTAVAANNMAMRANVIAVVISLLVTLGMIIYSHTKRVRESEEAQNSFNSSMQECNSLVAEQSGQVKALIDAIGRANKGTKERTALIDTFNSKYGQYLDNLITETSSVKDLASAYDQVVAAIRRKMEMQLRSKDYDSEVAPRLGMYQDRIYDFGQVSERFKDAVHSQTWLDAFIQDQEKKGNGAYNTRHALYAALGVSKNDYAAIEQNIKAIQSNPNSGYVKNFMKAIRTGKFPNVFGKGTDASAEGRKGIQAILGALAVQQYFSRVNAEEKVNKKWGDKGLLDPDAQTNKDKSDQSLTNDAAEAKLAAKRAREAAAAERRRIAAAKRAMNEEMQRAKTEATGIISKVEAYFNMQLAAIKKLVGKPNGFTPDQAVALTAQLKQEENNYLAAARFAISGHSKEHPELNFNTMRQQMGRGYNQFDHSKASDDMVKAIQGVNLDAIYKSLARFNGSEAVYGISSGAILDEIYKNGTQNLKENTDVQEKQVEAMDKAIDSLDHVSQLVRTYAQKFMDVRLDPVDLKALAAREYPGQGPNKENVSNANGGQVGNNANGYELSVVNVVGSSTKRLLSPFYQMLMQFPKNGYKPYVSDISTDRGMLEWINGLASNFSGKKNIDGTPVVAKWANNWQPLNRMLNGYENEKGEHIKGLNDVARIGNSGIADLDDLKKVLDANDGELRKNIKMLYQLLMQFGDDFWEEQKRRSDEVKKVIDEMWQRSNEKAALDAEQRMIHLKQQQEKLLGKAESDWKSFGFADTVRGDESDLALSRNSFEAAQQKYITAQYRLTSSDRIAAKQNAVTAAQGNLKTAQENSDTSALQKQLNEAMTKRDELSDTYANDLSVGGDDYAFVSLVRLNQATERVNALKAAIDKKEQNLQDAKSALAKAEDELASEQSKENNPELLQKYYDQAEEAKHAYYELLSNKVTDRMSELAKWTDPIEQLGTSMGEAFAQMAEDAEKGRDAVKAALLDMVKAYAQSSIQIIKELLLRQVKEELIRKQMAKDPLDKRNPNALFNNNGLPTGTIGSANIVISNANVNGQPANGVGQQVDVNGNPVAPGTTPTVDANGNPVNPANPNGAVNPANPNGAPAPSTNPQQQGANAAANAVSGTVENGFNVTSSIGTAATDLLGNTMGDIGNSIQEQLAQRRAKSNDKTNKKAEKKAKAHAKNMEKIEKDSSKNRESNQKNSNKVTLQAQDALQSGVQASTNQISQAVTKSSTEQQKANTETVSQNAKTDTEGGIVSGAGKIIARLGWWGIPLVAVITALLNGLLSAFLSKLGKGGSSESKAPNTKLKTGMLTYDSGNVQQYRGLLDGKSYPVVGTDGNVYAATSVPKAVTGIVNSPIATMINGEPSVVAEKGPEIVIGRQTTAAMMMNRPDLLKEIIEYDRNRSGMTYRAYDGGNIQQLTQQGMLPNGTSAMDMSQMQETLSTLTVAVAGLTSRLKEPIYAQMNPYGRGGAVDVMKKANDFLAKHK